MCFRVGFGFANASFISNNTLTTHFFWCQCHPLLIWWIYSDMFLIFMMQLFGLHIYCRMMNAVLAVCVRSVQQSSCLCTIQSVIVQWGPCGSPTGLKSKETESCCDSISAVHWWQIADFILDWFWCPTQVYMDYNHLGCQCRVLWSSCCFRPDSNNKILGEMLNVLSVKVLTWLWEKAVDIFFANCNSKPHLKVTKLSRLLMKTVVHLRCGWKAWR